MPYQSPGETFYRSRRDFLPDSVRSTNCRGRDAECGRTSAQSSSETAQTVTTEVIFMKTFMASPATIERKWYVVDATDMTLGRLASEIAKVLRGKNKPIFTPHMDTGDYVIVVNAEKVKVTGKKLEQKIYYHHSDYVGGMKETTLKEMLQRHPERVVEYAVKGMLPKGPLGSQMYKKLFVYVGPDHKHAAQKPEALTF